MALKQRRWLSPSVGFRSPAPPLTNGPMLTVVPECCYQSPLRSDKSASTMGAGARPRKQPDAPGLLIVLFSVNLPRVRYVGRARRCWHLGVQAESHPLSGEAMQMTHWPRNRTHWIAFPTGTSVALILLLLSGCSDRQKDSLTRLSPRSVPYLTGVAVPEGFRLADQMSEDYETGAVRVARHKYVGSADPHAIRTFYREQMPLLGWNRVSDQQVKGRITIRFEKRSEVCTVEIEESGVLSKTTIQVIVMPLDRSPTEPPRRKLP